MSFSPDIVSTRFGYGFPLPQDAPVTPEGMLAALAGPDRARQAWPLATLDVALPQIQHAIALRKAQKDATDPLAYKAALNVLDKQVIGAARVTVARALDSGDGLRERLVAFWANHFCTRAKDRTMAYLPVLMIEEAIRPNLTGSFADLLIAATTHPAMVLYLDQNTSYGPDSKRGKKTGKGLNENLAREVMELHSLGVAANYTQTDVRQMANLLTGLTFNADTGDTFDPGRAEPGAETVLGKSYGGDGMAPIRAVLTDLAARPDTATHIATKLARHFVADTPPPDLVAALRQAYLDGQGQLMPVYEALLSRPEVSDPALTKARWPQDYIVTGLRALGVTGADLPGLAEGPFRRTVIKALAGMGQPWLMPPGPNGFSEAAEDWINPPYLAARISWSMNVPNDVLGPLPEPVAILARALGDRASPALATAVSRAETKVEGLGLILASAELNRR
jgi:uncharacterized protein (DUF1800 family)